MTFNYSGSVATAERLIAKFGQDVTLNKQGAETGDAWDATFAADVPTTIKVVDLKEKERDRNGIYTGKTTRKLLISTSAGVTPEKGDAVVIGGLSHFLGVVEPLSPGGVIVLWKAELES